MAEYRQHRLDHDCRLREATLDGERACSTFSVPAVLPYDLSPAFIWLNALNGVQASNLSAPVGAIGPARATPVQWRSRILNLDLDPSPVDHTEGSSHAMKCQASSAFRDCTHRWHWLRVTWRPR